MAKVKVYQATYDDLEELIPRVFRDFPFSFKNKRVFIKPNMLSARRPEEGVTTNPKLVKEIVKYILAEGGEVLVGDNPSLMGEGIQMRVGEKTGIKEASLGKFCDITRNPRLVKVPELGELAVSSEILDCDILLSLPKFKTHPLTILTGAVKNMFGILVGVEKPRLHYRFPTSKEFSSVLPLIYEIRRPDLTIIDGIIGMEGFGPSNGTLRMINRLIVSRDGYACDWVMAQMVKVEPERLEFLNQAEKRGLFLPKEITVEGDFITVEKFKLPIKVGDNLLSRSFLKLLYHPVRYKRIRIEKKRCRLCSLCVQICPKSALVIKGKGLKYKRKDCIACFCCQEVCPEGAIKPA